MRGRCEARGLRRLRITPQVQVPFAFTTPLSLVRSMTRTRVRLLGPCFKTGRRGRRPTRDRETARASETLAIRDRSRARRPRSQAPGIRGKPRTLSRAMVHRQRFVAQSPGEVQSPETPIPRAECLRINHPRHGATVNLNLRNDFEEPLRLPLHSFTYY